jgi:hypothetical protein
MKFVSLLQVGTYKKAALAAAGLGATGATLANYHGGSATDDHTTGSSQKPVPGRGSASATVSNAVVARK